jgi:hypothetical protein
MPAHSSNLRGTICMVLASGVLVLLLDRRSKAAR